MLFNAGTCQRGDVMLQLALTIDEARVAFVHYSVILVLLFWEQLVVYWRSRLLNPPDFEQYTEL